MLDWQPNAYFAPITYPQWDNFHSLFYVTNVSLLCFLTFSSSFFFLCSPLFLFFFHFVDEFFGPYFKEHLRIRIKFLAIFLIIPICLLKIYFIWSMYTKKTKYLLLARVVYDSSWNYLHLMNLWQGFTFVIHFCQNGWSTLWRKKTRIQLLFWGPCLELYVNRFDAKLFRIFRNYSPNH